MLNPNSRTVYETLILPEIKQRHKAVVEAFKVLGEATSYDIADYLNVPVHTLSGRLSELSGKASTNKYDKPIIEVIGKKNNKYNNPCDLYRLKFYQKQGEQGGLFG